MEQDGYETRRPAVCRGLRDQQGQGSLLSSRAQEARRPAGPRRPGDSRAQEARAPVEQDTSRIPEAKRQVELETSRPRRIGDQKNYCALGWKEARRGWRV